MSSVKDTMQALNTALRPQSHIPSSRGSTSFVYKSLSAFRQSLPRPVLAFSNLRTLHHWRTINGRQLTSFLGHATESSPQAASSFAATESSLVRQEDGSLTPAPTQPGIYAFYDKEEELQYIGLSRKISDTIAGYARLLPDLTHKVKFVTPGHSTREELVEVWKGWMQEAVKETGKVPPGNQKDNDTWTPKRPQKGEIKLTPGKGIQDLSCTIADLIGQVVKSNKVVAFVKGTRQQPQCGFSYKVLSTLNELGANYEVLNVLDEVYNPGLREAIKEYSQWPTIPQLYVNGELVGGADIIEEMHSRGELKQLLKS